MRVNIYSQELLLDHREVKLVERKAENGVTYSGIRVFMHSSNRLHDTANDDDRSAVTFWLPKSSTHRSALAGVFSKMSMLVQKAQLATERLDT